MSENSFPALPSQASVKSAVSASSLPALPIEIITEIFKSTDSFSTAAALAGTCHGLHSVWKSNAASICYALLVRTIPCYDQAFQYVQVQQLDTVRSGLIDVTDLPAVEATKRLVENADNAHVASQLYETQMDKLVPSDPDEVPRAVQIYQSPERLTEAQRECFLKAWYRLHTLASLPSDPLTYSILASLDRLEFEQMRDVLRWLRIQFISKRGTKYEPRIRRFNFIRGFYQHVALVKSHITENQWHEINGRLNSLFKKSPSRLFNFWRFIRHEVCLDIEESGKGDSLADKLPPMNKRDTPHLFTDSFREFISRGAVAQQRHCHLA